MADAKLNVKRAEMADLDTLVPLFDGYRVFYNHPSDLSLARSFLAERLTNSDSIILIARTGEQAVGFTQLYPTFSSTRAWRTFILNDLFVYGSARKSGVGEALLEAAKTAATEAGGKRLTLSTAHSNGAAQALYERNGWVQDMAFRVYNFSLSD
jgi:ribosomal protein S18 acetylase RimI-like enzyme